MITESIIEPMTWVIGRAGPFGYAVGLSDIRVTLHDGTEVDCLQKIYRVGSNMVLGFAGSVQIGFKIVEELSAGLLVTESKYPLDPFIISKYLYVGTQNIFNSFSQEIRGGGCHLMLLSAHPKENDGVAPWARCYVHRFYAPDFQPVVSRHAEIVSIGSGKKIADYSSILRSQEKDFDMFKLEVGMKGGAALGLMVSISSAIKKMPKRGISTHLHICIVGRNEVKVGKNDITGHEHSEDDFLMPPVAQSWNELVEILRSKGVARSAIEEAQC